MAISYLLDDHTLLIGNQCFEWAELCIYKRRHCRVTQTKPIFSANNWPRDAFYEWSVNLNKLHALNSVLYFEQYKMYYYGSWQIPILIEITFMRQYKNALLQLPIQDQEDVR